MPKNYKDKIYDNYVSLHTDPHGWAAKEDHKKSWPYYERKYVPLFSSLNKNASILEVACGPGLFLEFLLSQGYKNLMGIDLSPEQVKIARKYVDNVVEGDVFEFLASTDKKFDMIIAFDILEHFTKQECFDFTELVYNKLNPNGLFLLRTPNGAGLFSSKMIYDDITHCTVFTGKSLSQMMRANNFSVLGFRESSPEPIGFKGTIRYLIWELIKKVANFMMKIETGWTTGAWSQNIICIAQKNKQPDIAN
jgi:2-polyprenyl-3-methyl-5-hydroxy-6-metoxy-1,4-benzoquinol methylase